MIPLDKKKAVGIILAKHKDGGMAHGGVVNNEQQIDPNMEAFHSHAQSIMSAIHNKSPAELVSAMRNFLDEHEMHQDQDGEEPSDYSPKK